MGQPFACWEILGAACLIALPVQGEDYTVETRRQLQLNGEWQAHSTPTRLNPHKTAVIICDMWDRHTCPQAEARVAEMAPRMETLVTALRRQGVFIIHCPSNTMAFYAETSQRRLAQAAPLATPVTPLLAWRKLDSTKEPALPIDDSDGGCDCARTWKPGDKYPWTRQIETLTIAPGDAITDSREAYDLMEQRQLDTLLIMGVHLNMCVLGRPFGIRQMRAQGKRVLLVRDLTDCMYNPAMAPHVTHFAGTALLVTHVERYWCPTLTSAAILGGAPFRFAGDR